MSSVIISGDTSGAITVSAPAVAGTNTLTLQAATATNAVNKLETAVASTSGTSIDFTSLPSWIKRITVMLAGVSSNGTSNFQVQIGAGSIDATSYTSVVSAGAGAYTSTTGFILTGVISAALSRNGTCVLTSVGSNLWVASSVIANSDTTYTTSIGAGQKTLSGTLDRVRITTVNGIDTFDAGSVNLLLEG